MLPENIPSATYERHGHSGNKPRSREYAAWASMKQRCLNPDAKGYENYGGRGIKIYPEWIESFTAFLLAVGPKPDPSFSIERIDNDGNYEPGNVEWANRTKQQNNRRVTVWVDVDGEDLTIRQVSQRFGLSASLIRQRIQNGCEGDDLTRPLSRISNQCARLPVFKPSKESTHA